MSRYMLSDQLIRRHRKPQSPRSRRRATHSRYCRALRMEPLEDRTVLSTFFVTTTADTIDADPERHQLAGSDSGCERRRQLS